MKIVTQIVRCFTLGVCLLVGSFGAGIVARCLVWAFKLGWKVVGL